MDKIEYGLLLKSHPPEEAKELLSNRYSVFGSQKPFLVFHRGPQEPKPPKRSGQPKKAAATRALAEFMAEGNHKYEKYEPLHDIWQSYIADVLGNQPERDLTGAAQRFLGADWNGAKFRVVAAKNPSLVGKSGIVLWENRGIVLLITRANKLCQVPKSGTVFRNMTEPRFEVVGSRLQVRSVDRSTRKFKPHDVADVAQLLDLP